MVKPLIFHAKINFIAVYAEAIWIRKAVAMLHRRKWFSSVPHFIQKGADVFLNKWISIQKNLKNCDDAQTLIYSLIHYTLVQIGPIEYEISML